jgi:hypothetical protein
MKAHILLCVCGVLSLALAGCGENSGKSGSATNTSKGPTPLSAPADYVGAIGAAKNLAEKTVDLTTLNQAIQMFQADKGRFPKDLDELIQEKLIVQIPRAPYGKKIVYDAEKGKVSIVNAQ